MHSTEHAPHAPREHMTTTAMERKEITFTRLKFSQPIFAAIRARAPMLDALTDDTAVLNDSADHRPK
jgi:hypothetical protein